MSVLETLLYGKKKRSFLKIRSFSVFEAVLWNRMSPKHWLHVKVVLKLLQFYRKKIIQCGKKKEKVFGTFVVPLFIS